MKKEKCSRPWNSQQNIPGSFTAHRNAPSPRCQPEPDRKKRNSLEQLDAFERANLELHSRALKTLVATIKNYVQ
jgi:hypothetical protein